MRPEIFDDWFVITVVIVLVIFGTIYSGVMLERFGKWARLYREARNDAKGSYADGSARWSFICVAPGEARRQIPTFTGPCEAACDAIEAGGVFRISNVDH